jgi:hypothetical protein
MSLVLVFDRNLVIFGELTNWVILINSHSLQCQVTGLVRFQVLIDVRIVVSDDQANGFLLVVPHQGISDLPVTPGWCDASLLYAADDLRVVTSLFILLHRARIRHIFYLLI